MKRAVIILAAVAVSACGRREDLREPDWTLTTFRQRFWHGSCSMTLPTFRDGVLYLGGGYPFAGGSYVQAFDLQADAEIWRRQVGVGLTGQELLVDGDILYVGAQDKLLALDRQRGTQLWTFGVAGYERVAGDGVVYTSSGRAVVALGGETGTELWRIDTTEPLEESPVLLGDRLYVRDAGALLIIDRLSGDRIESPRRFTDVARLDAIGSRLWFTVRTTDPQGRATMAWDPGDDTLTVHAGEIVGSAQGVAFLADGESLRLVDTADDRELATYDGLPTARLGGVVIDGGTMFQQDLTGRPRAINAFDLTTGRRSWTFEAGDMVWSPVLARQRLWVSSEDCRLYAFDLDP